MKSVAILSVLATSVYASSPYIPSGISDACSSFLNTLDGDSSLTACASPLIDATSSFASSSSPASAAAVSSALSSLSAASASSACSESDIRTELASFYSACTAELTGSGANTNVQRMYDELYILNPLSTAITAKDSQGNYCVNKIPAAATSDSAVSSALGSLTTSQSTLTVPNAASYDASNLLFLFSQPSLNKTDLCTDCTRDIVSAYTNFMSSVPYAMGMSQSPMISGFSSLYDAVVNTCGSSFLSGAVQAAGGLKNGGSSSGAESFATVNLGAVGASLAAVAVAFATLF